MTAGVVEEEWSDSACSFCSTCLPFRIVVGYNEKSATISLQVLLARTTFIRFVSSYYIHDSSLVAMIHTHSTSHDDFAHPYCFLILDDFHNFHRGMNGQYNYIRCTSNSYRQSGSILIDSLKSSGTVNSRNGFQIRKL